MPDFVNITLTLQYPSSLWVTVISYYVSHKGMLTSEVHLWYLIWTAYLESYITGSAQAPVLAFSWVSAYPSMYNLNLETIRLWSMWKNESCQVLSWPWNKGHRKWRWSPPFYYYATWTSICSEQINWWMRTAKWAGDIKKS